MNPPPHFGERPRVVVIGSGPAGVFAALRAADLGARTTLVTSGAYGGMAALDGPVPVRTLAHAARLAREARQLEQYGIQVGSAALDYDRLLARVREVVEQVGRRSALRAEVEALGVEVHERTGAARFTDPQTIKTESGLVLVADRFVICTGGVSHRLSVPGFDLTCTHSDAWGLAAAPASMLVIGGGATGAQVASIFNAFGTRVDLFQAGPRLVPTEDEDVSAAVASGFRASGIRVHEAFGSIDAFERTPDGVRMLYSRDGAQVSAEATLAVVAVGWTAAVEALNLPAAGVETDARGFIRVDAGMATTAPHIFAAGDVTGGLMLAPQAMREGWRAATKALGGDVAETAPDAIPGAPIGSFTEPEYAQVGFTEAAARDGHDVVTATSHYGSSSRPIIDGRTDGFCKLVVERGTGRILGCHLVGERAVDIAQMAAIAIAGGMDVTALAKTPFSFPTYAAVLGRAAALAAGKVNRGEAWRNPALASATLVG